MKAKGNLWLQLKLLVQVFLSLKVFLNLQVIHIKLTR